MKVNPIFILILILHLFTSCYEKEGDLAGLQQKEQELQKLTQQLTEAEVKDDITSYMQHFSEQAICMPEYQITLDGRNEIEKYYSEIFKRQNIQILNRQAHEFIHLNNTIVEIGTFKKGYTTAGIDSLIVLSGKYWHIWSVLPDGGYKIKGEISNYFYPVAHPESLILSEAQQQPDESQLTSFPFELKAYNALMEKGVRLRNAPLRYSFFTEDAIIYPFADTIYSGLDQIKPYLTEYSNRRWVSIDTVNCYTYAYEDLNDYMLEYSMFKVKWSRKEIFGRTEGKGIRIWKRQPDKSLRLFREIGTHNFL
jgi:ketosteroid isomerase-like protein